MGDIMMDLSYGWIILMHIIQEEKTFIQILLSANSEPSIFD
jgi:hypothetical protein